MRLTKQQLEKMSKETGQELPKITRTQAEQQREHNAIVDQIHDWCEANKIYCVKVEASNVRDFVGNIRPKTRKGTPDLLLGIPPVPVFHWLDVKTGEEKRANQWQADEWPRMSDLGVTGEMVGNLDEAMAYIAAWRKDAEALHKSMSATTQQFMQLTGAIFFRMERGYPAAHYDWIKREIQTAQAMLRGKPEGVMFERAKQDAAVLEAAKQYAVSPTIENGERIINLSKHFAEAN